MAGKTVVFVTFEGADPSMFPIVVAAYSWPRNKDTAPFYEATIEGAGVMELPFKPSMPVATVIKFGDGTETESAPFGMRFIKGPFSPPEKRGIVKVSIGKSVKS